EIDIDTKFPGRVLKLLVEEGDMVKAGQIIAIMDTRDLEAELKLRAEAARAHNKRTAAYLLGMPLLADYLEEALSLFVRSCDDFEMGHL
ncbi:MAG: biotin/lipoyl-binding protein, partial [Methylocella sp.]